MNHKHRSAYCSFVHGVVNPENIAHGQYLAGITHYTVSTGRFRALKAAARLSFVSRPWTKHHTVLLSATAATAVNTSLDLLREIIVSRRVNLPANLQDARE